MQAKLAILAVSLFLIFSACEDPSNIGLELDPNNNQLGVFYQEIPLTPSLIWLDSISTTNSESLVFGIEDDEFFGKTEATAYTRLFFNRDFRLPQSNATLDSVILNLNFRTVLSKDVSSPKKVFIHELSEQILDQEYFTTSSLEFDPNPALSLEVDFSNRQDTIVTVNVDGPFVNKIFEAMKDGNAFSDIFAFREFLPGLVFKGDEEDNSSYSVTVGNNTGLVFFFTNEGDSISRPYPIASGINFNLARHFSQVEHDGTGTPVEVVKENYVAYNTGQIVGGKSTLGFLVKLNTSPLEEFLDTLQNAILNRVELEVGPLERNLPTRRAPDRLLMFMTNETNRFLFRTDGQPILVQQDGIPQVDPETGEPLFTQQPANLILVRESNTYNQFITSHVNAVYRRNIPRRDFILYPASSLNDRSFVQSLRDYTLDQDKIKLKIFYSRNLAF